MELFKTDIIKLKSKGAVGKLIKLFNGKNDKLKSDARKALIELGEPAAKKLCKNILNDSHKQVLIEIGKASTTPLLNLLKGSNSTKQKHAIAVLEQLYKDDMDPSIAQTIINCSVKLDQIANQEKIELAKKLVAEYRSISMKMKSDLDRLMQAGADWREISSLGNVDMANNPGSHVPLQNRQREIREELLKLGPVIIPKLLPLCIDEYGKTTDVASEILYKFEDNAIKYLITSYNLHLSSKISELIISRLIDFDNIMAIPTIIEALNHKNNDVRKEAADLWRNEGENKIVRDPRLIIPLLKLLTENDEIIRSTALQSLGKSHNPDALQHLINALDDSESYIKQAAIKGLGFLEDPRAINVLCKVLTEDSNSTFRGYAAQSLGMIKDNDNISKKALINSIRKDDDKYVQLHAIEALMKLGLEDSIKSTILKRIEPWLLKDIDNFSLHISTRESYKNILSFLTNNKNTC